MCFQVKSPSKEEKTEKNTAQRAQKYNDKNPERITKSSRQKSEKKKKGKCGASPRFPIRSYNPLLLLLLLLVPAGALGSNQSTLDANKLALEAPRDGTCPRCAAMAGCSCCEAPCCDATAMRMRQHSWNSTANGLGLPIPWFPLSDEQFDLVFRVWLSVFLCLVVLIPELQVKHNPYTACRIGEASNPGPECNSEQSLATSLLAVLEQFRSKQSDNKTTGEPQVKRKPALASILLQCLQAAVAQGWSDEQVADRMVEKIHKHVGASVENVNTTPDSVGNSRFVRQSFYTQKPKPREIWKDYQKDFPELESKPQPKSKGKGLSATAANAAYPLRKGERKGKGKGKQVAPAVKGPPPSAPASAKCASFLAAAEWTAPVTLVSFSQFRKALDNGDSNLPGNILLTRDPDVVSQLQDLWSAHAVSHTLTVGLKTSHSSPGPLVSVWWNGTSPAKSPPQKVKFELTQSGKDEGPTIQAPEKVVIHDKVGPKMVTLRVLAPSWYRESCTNLQTKDTPADVIRQLASSSGQRVCLFTGGNWQAVQHKKGVILIGHLRFPQELATKILSCSGQQAVFLSILPSKHHEPKQVVWLPRKQGLSDESYLNVCRESSLQKKLPLAFRVTTPRRTPMDFKAKPPEKSKDVTFWYFTDNADQDTAHINIFPEGPRKRKNLPQSEWLAPVKKRWVDHESDSIKGGPPSVAPTQIDSSQNADSNKEKERGRSRSPARNGKGQATNAGSEPSTASSGAVSNSLLRDNPNFEEVDRGGCGDCFFRIAAHWQSIFQAKNIPSDKIHTEAAKLRLAAIEHIKKHRKEYLPFWSVDPGEPANFRGGHDIPESFDAYLKVAAKQGYWVDEVLFSALATRLGCIIIVFGWDTGAKFGLGGGPFSDDEATAGSCCSLSLPPATPGRSCVAPSCAESSLVLLAGMPARGSDIPRRFRLHGKQSDPFAAGGLEYTSVAAASDASARIICDDEIPTQPPPKRKAGGPAELDTPEYVWTCPYCDIVISAPTSKKRTEARSNHLANRHKDRKVNNKDVIRYLTPAIPVSPYIPQEERSWTCPVCEGGLPGMSKGQKEKSIKHHWETAHPGQNTPQNQAIWRTKRMKNKPKPELSKKLCERFDTTEKKDTSGHCTIRFHPHEDTLKAAATRRKKGFRSRAVTCSKCWRVQFRAGWTDSPCPGQVETPPEHGYLQQGRVWFRLRQNEPGTARQLAELWKTDIDTVDSTVLTSKQLADLKKEVLVQQGIELNSGPSADIMSVYTCNIRSGNGAWAFLDYAASRQNDELCVFALQETRLSPAEATAFRRASHKRGFRCFHTAGRESSDRWGQARQNGGVAWLIDKRLRTSRPCGKSGTHAQLLGIHVEGWYLANFYTPPDDASREVSSENELGCLIHDLCVHEGLHKVPWLMCGDANCTPDSPSLPGVFNLHQGQLLRIHEATRWEGTREIDWNVTSHFSGISQTPEKIKLVFADHFALKTVLAIHPKDLNARLLKKGPSWTRPNHLPTEDWQQLLADVWGRKSLSRPIEEAIMDRHRDSNQRWDIFLNQIDVLMRCAYNQVLDSNQEGCDRKTLQVASKNKRIKGGTPEFIHRTARRTNPIFKKGDMWLVKLRKRVARLYEVRRALQQRSVQPDSRLALSAPDLLRKLQLPENVTQKEVLKNFG
eukprot:s1103_g13.t1